MMMMRRVAVIASASGNGKTTLARELAGRLDLSFVELDALVHGPGWVETPDAELRRLVEPVVRSEGWVIDGAYLRKLGTLVLDAADTIVWLDLPMRVWMWRLLRRTLRRLSGREQLWNGNRESLRTAVWVATHYSATPCAITAWRAARGPPNWSATRWCGSRRRRRSSTGLAQSPRRTPCVPRQPFPAKGRREPDGSGRRETAEQRLAGDVIPRPVRCPVPGWNGRSQLPRLVGYRPARAV